VSVRAHSDRRGAAVSVHVLRAKTKKSKNDVITQKKTLMNQYYYGKKFKESHLFFNVKTFLRALPPPPGHPPHCDNAVLPIS
jgi:hypothetical protein